MRQLAQKKIAKLQSGKKSLLQNQKRFQQNQSVKNTEKRYKKASQNLIFCFKYNWLLYFLKPAS
ncbi:hypothetical protein P2P36_26815, partial [Escherichia coli]